MRCNYCEWRCELGGGKPGVCRMYAEQNGAIRERFPSKWCFYGTSLIESIPFYHVSPGSRSMTVGTAGCNFSCRYCSNAFIAKEGPDKIQDRMFDLTPREIVLMARKLDCASIVFNVNEPAVSLPTLLELAKEAESGGIALGCLTNGYTTDESTGLLESIFSFFNIGLKGLSAEFNRAYIGIPSAAPILRNIERLARTRHVEVTTPVIQSVNDHELDEMAGFLARIDREIPWHVFRLLPEDEMKEAAYPNIEAINEALISARERLSYVYFHNFVGSDWVNTLCPRCGSLLIERFSLGCGGDRLTRVLSDGNRCPSCCTELKLLSGVGESRQPEARL
jgi:pyruvate formate lyase activating enzyme